MSEIMIKTDNLCKSYRYVKAVRDVSITVEKGAIVGLIGKNGAGKTTLIRILTGLVVPTSGTFEVVPEQVRTNTTVAAIVERPSIYTDMTAIDNLRAQCKLLSIPIDEEYLNQTLKLVGLIPASKQLAKNFSLGMKQRLAIAMTLVGKPQLLLLDEPTNGLDPKGIHDMREVFIRLNKEFGTTLVVSSHILSELSKFATEYYFMDKGRVIKHLTAEELDQMGTHRLKITVSDTEKAKAVLESYGTVTITSENTVELEGDTPPTQVLLALAKEDVTATNIVNVSDNLEEFFISLVEAKK